MLIVICIIFFSFSIFITIIIINNIIIIIVIIIIIANQPTNCLLPKAGVLRYVIETFIVKMIYLLSCLCVFFSKINDILLLFPSN